MGRSAQSVVRERHRLRLNFVIGSEAEEKLIVAKHILEN
jgi:hypothetical protein